MKKKKKNVMAAGCAANGTGTYLERYSLCKKNLIISIMI